MKFYLALLAFASIAVAGPICTTGTLASYESLGSGGCTIGSVTVGSFGVVSGTFGATPISPTAVTVTPVGSTANPELDFSVSLTANAPTLLESIFTYQIFGPTFTHDTINLFNSSETYDGAVTDIQNICAGGTFGPSGVTGCTGASLSLLTLDGVFNEDDTAIAASTFLSITDDFTLDGGTAGSASGGLFDDQFTTTGVTSAATPEPGGLILAFSGLAFVAARKFRFIRR